MTLAAANLTRATACRIVIRPEFGWRHVARAGVELWTKGYGRVEKAETLLGRLGQLGPVPRAEDIAAIVAALDGHFALAARGSGWAFAAVDWVRSIPARLGARCRRLVD